MKIDENCLRLAGVSVLALALAGCDASAFGLWKKGGSQRSEASGAPASLATPVGITIQPLGKAQGYGLDKESATLLPRDEIAYADARGMTLYTYEKDSAGKSVCVDDCAKRWPPALAAADAQPIGAWSLIERADGTKQWALKGKPLYTYAEDVDIGSVAGNSPKIFGRGPNVGPRGSYSGERPEPKPMPEGWQAALLYPMSEVTLPANFAIKEVPDALGLALVTAQGQTLYTFKGDVNKDSRACENAPCGWTPLAAPQIASPLGDFAFVIREDGIKQWTWKGQPLYTYQDDFAPGIANGVGVNESWQVAHMLRYFMPENVTVQRNARLGKILANENGLTLYRRDGFIFQSGSGHNLRRGTTVRPAVGRDIGTDPRCESEACKENWTPFFAPADAKPSSYWDVSTRADGKKQWVYQGFALWTYTGDEKPGDINGNDTYQLAISDSPNRMVDIGTPYDGPTALYWSVGIP